MSYKRAWGLVEMLNGMFRAPLVRSSRGGAAHGGAELTEAGVRVLDLHRTMQAKGAAAVSDETRALEGLSIMSGQK